MHQRESVVVENKIVTLENIEKFVDGASVARVGEITYDIAQKVVDEYMHHRRIFRYFLM